MENEEEKFVEISIKLFEELEKTMAIHNNYTKDRPHDKQQSAFLEGIITALGVITCYTYTFDKSSNKIKKIIYKEI